MDDFLETPDRVVADDIFSGTPAAVPDEVRKAAGVLKQVSTVAPAGGVEAKKLSVKETVIALFRETEPDLRALAERYREVVYDVKTPKGLKDCKAARHDLRENGRYAVQRAEERVKKELNGAKAVVTDEVARLIAITKATEDGYDKQITAREAEIEAEKAEAARLEKVAQDENAARCAKLTDCIAKATGKTSEQIGNAIAHIEQLAITSEKWGGRADFMAAGEAAKIETLQALRRLKIEAKNAEDLVALRAENERMARELAERQRREADAQAARDAEVAAARQSEADARAAQTAAEAEEAAAAAEVARLAQLVAEAPPAPVVAEPPAPKTSDEMSCIDTIEQERANRERLETPAPGLNAWAPRFNAAAVAPQPDEARAPDYNACLDAQLQEPSTDPNPTRVDPVCEILAMLRAELNGPFASQPKPSVAWWAKVRRLVAEVSA